MLILAIQGVHKVSLFFKNQQNLCFEIFLFGLFCGEGKGLKFFLFCLVFFEIVRFEIIICLIVKQNLF